MTRDVVVVAGSTGALQPLTDLLAGLPATFRASVFVVIHTSPDAPGMLPKLLQRRAAIPVAFAEDGDTIEPGRVYVAPPDRHLLVDACTVQVTRGPRENGFRPAADPLFRTAALQFGSRVVGIVLSGGLSDGTHGLALIKARGGVAVVQPIEEATATGMPANAIRSVDIDHVVPAAEMAPLLLRLVAESPPDVPAAAAPQRTKPDRAERGSHELREGAVNGLPSAFTCPECGGMLSEKTDEPLNRFSCHVGHSYTPEALASGMAAKLETALWTALRVLEENREFFRRMEKRALSQGLSLIADGFRAKAGDAEARAEIVREALVDHVPKAPVGEVAGATADAAPVPPGSDRTD